MRDRIIKLLATGFGLGYLPIAPGSCGTLLGIPLVLGLQWLGPLPYMVITFLLTIAACLIADRAGVLFGETDSRHIVIDEVVGFAVTMVWLPSTWKALLAGFIIFRILDALKPWPISYVERKIGGGVGVVADDVVAGIIGSVILQVVYNKTPWLGTQLL